MQEKYKLHTSIVNEIFGERKLGKSPLLECIPEFWNIWGNLSQYTFYDSFYNRIKIGIIFVIRDYKTYQNVHEIL